MKGVENFNLARRWSLGFWTTIQNNKYPMVDQNWKPGICWVAFEKCNLLRDRDMSLLITIGIHEFVLNYFAERSLKKSKVCRKRQSFGRMIFRILGNHKRIININLVITIRISLFTVRNIIYQESAGGKKRQSVRNMFFVIRGSYDKLLFRISS